MDRLILTSILITTLALADISAQIDSIVSTTDKYKKSLELARKKNDYQVLADVYYKYGVYELNQNQEQGKSFDYLTNSLEYYELLNDTAGVYKSKFQLARHFLENEMYSDALAEFLSIRQYYSNDIRNVQKSAETELKLFEVYIEKLNIDAAKESLDNARIFLDGIENDSLERQYLIEKIQYHKLVRELDIALTLANQCVENSKILESEEGLSICLANRGDVRLAQEKHIPAIYDYKRSLPYVNSKPYSRRRLRVYKNLAECYRAINKNSEAFFYMQKFAQLQDSIYSEKRTNALNNLTYKHQSEKKSREIRLLELEKDFAFENNQQQRRALSVLGIGVGLLLLFIYYINRFYKEKIKNANIIKVQNDKINQQKINELQDKIQINSMQSMLTGQELERERISKDLHDSLGGLLSTIKLQVDHLSSKESKVELIPEYKKATQLLDTAVGEVRSISQNLQPVALNKLGLIPALNDLINRYNTSSGPEIHFQHFGIPKKMDQMVSLGIFRIIQEILNNAIKHAQATEVLVQLNKEDDNIIIHVEDDGVGFNSEAKYKSMGLENIKSRVNYLKGTIEIDSRPNNGTSFLINVSNRIA